MKVTQKHLSTFSKPQHQASAGLWIEAFKAFKRFYQLIGLALVYIVVRIPSNQILLWGLTGLIIVLILVFGWLRYKSIIFYIDEENEEFILKGGVFDKKNITVKLNKIQQVLITQHILQKMLKVYTVAISTAGSKGAEVSIHAMKLEDAKALKSRLLFVKKAGTEDIETLSGDETSQPADAEKQFKLANSTIFKVAATSRYGKSLAIISGALSAAYNSWAELFGLGNLDQQLGDVNNLDIIFRNSFIIASIILLVWVVFNISGGFLRFYNYRIIFTKDALQVRYGAIKSSNAIIYANKVQIFKVIQNYLQRKMKLSRVVFEQASSDFAADQKAVIEIPGCTKDQEINFDQYIFNKNEEKKKIIRPDYKKLLPFFYLYMVVPAIAIFFFYESLPALVILAFPIWLTAIGLIDYFAYKHSKLEIDPNFIIIQSGVWNITTKKMESYKIQGIKVTQRLWHRKSGIAHITLLTAATNLKFKFVRLEEINPYLNKWLYDAEVAEREWM